MNITKDNLINPPKKYRSLPFWSWNAKLETEETVSQVDEMNQNGIGGFFMHARGGLKTPYMGDEWIENVRASVLEAEKLGMSPWGYDENGWPSGFGSDAVNGLGIDYQQKYLRMEITDSPIVRDDGRTIANIPAENNKNAHFYYDVNIFYVDTMDPKVTDEFIKVTHEKYKKALENDFKKLAGFFTDEPQLSRDGIPWSFTLPGEYIKEYGENLLGKLYDLFCDTETSVRTRYRFWKLVTRLFCENFLGRIYKWCDENGVKLTGHMLLEENLLTQLDCNGAVMPNYEYLHIPGVDKLVRGISRDLLAPQVTSVCAQLGKKQILTESFALCGWDVSFEELKWVLEWQMVKGINLLCQHLEGYSLEGLRKRDYPSGHFYQNPWWHQYKDFLDFAARMGMLLAEGEIQCSVLVLHNIASAWAVRGGENFTQKIEKYNAAILETAQTLDKNQILYHLGDERIMERHASSENGLLRIGEMSYDTVIVPSSLVISKNTLELLKKFSESGGKLIFAGEIPKYVDGVESEEPSLLKSVHTESYDELINLLSKSSKRCSITDADGKTLDIQYAYRKFDNFEMYYFVNSFSGKCENAKITVAGQSAACFDYMTGETVPCTFSVKNGELTVYHTFEEKGSFVIFVRKDGEYISECTANADTVSINDKLRGDWKIAEADHNLLTLDYCDCYFDGELVEKKMYIGDIQEKACALGRKVNIRMDFKVNSDFEPTEKMYLIAEQPDAFRILINEQETEKKKCGYYRDKSFIKLDITGKLSCGENTITLITDFVQPKEVYDQLDNCLKFESAKNKLWYDMEIEAIYLAGTFGVKSDKDFVPAPNDSVLNSGVFTITEMPEYVSDGDITEMGFPFFCGHMKLEKQIILTADEIQNRSAELSRRCSAVSYFTVNGTKLPEIYWAPYKSDFSGLLHEGVNTIQLDIIGNFRNMLGPHHLPYECYAVCPGSFMHVSPIWLPGGAGDNWFEGYSFVKYGLFLK